MKKELVINKKVYKPAELTFNNVCLLEEMGADITHPQAKSMTFMRAYFALCMDATAEEAGDEMQAHVINGGDFAELGTCLWEAIEESDFFQALNKRAGATSTASEAEAKA